MLEKETPNFKADAKNIPIDSYSWREQQQNIKDKKGDKLQIVDGPSQKAKDIAELLRIEKLEQTRSAIAAVKEKDEKNERTVNSDIKRSDGVKKVSEIKADRRSFFANVLNDIAQEFKEGHKQVRQTNLSQPSESGQKKMTRRNFLEFFKHLGEAAVALPLTDFASRYYSGRGLIDWGKKIFGFEHDVAEKPEEIEVESKNDEEETKPQVTLEQEKRNEEEAREIRNIIKLNPNEPDKKIIFGEKEAGELYRNYFNKLSNESEQKPKLEKAYSQVRSWMEVKGEESISHIFQREFIDKLAKTEEMTDEQKQEFYYTYIALIIRESEGDPRAFSPAGAAGMHQFMIKTGHDYHLHQDINVDERFDPIKSATACARYLYKLYHDYKDMRLVLHAYNGIVGKYAKEVKEKNKTGSDEKITYQGYLRFIETEINEKRDKILENKSLNQPAKEKAFAEAMSGYTQNMNYVPYIMAVKDVLLQAAKNGQLPSKTENIIVKGHIRTKEVRKAKIITVRYKDTIHSLARKYKIEPAKILKLNPDLKVEKRGKRVIVRLKAGDELIVKEAEHTTLEGLAKGNKKVLEDLATLNPQIIKREKPIADGKMIRIGNVS
jgi:hypothetical protein